jgi:hypothetical protein
MDFKPFAPLVNLENILSRPLNFLNIPIDPIAHKAISILPEWSDINLKAGVI